MYLKLGIKFILIFFFSTVITGCFELAGGGRNSIKGLESKLLPDKFELSGVSGNYMGFTLNKTYTYQDYVYVAQKSYDKKKVEWISTIGTTRADFWLAAFLSDEHLDHLVFAKVREIEKNRFKLFEVNQDIVGAIRQELESKYRRRALNSEETYLFNKLAHLGCFHVYQNEFQCKPREKGLKEALEGLDILDKAMGNQKTIFKEIGVVDLYPI